MTDGEGKVPFGFRQDVEPERKPAKDDKGSTSINTSLIWTPVVREPFHMGDNAPRRSGIH